MKATELPKATVRLLHPERNRGRCLGIVDLFLVPGQNAESAAVSVGATEDVDGQSGGARSAGKLFSRHVYCTTAIRLANTALCD